MRIIAGEAKGTKLKMVPGKHVRPTSDRVKESIFQVLGPFFSGGHVLDLFAGTGALGLEALSRGMDEAIFVDQSMKSIETIRQNIKLAKLESRTKVIKKDARLVCRTLAKQGRSFSLVFLDPPYQRDLLLPTIAEIAEQNLLPTDGKLVAELPADAWLPEDIGRLSKEMVRSYGSTSIYIYCFKRKKSQGEMSR